jgi:NAD(P)-dependent dehydrogenase (short-subunit alcohol dehydrogenase family)
VVSKHGVVAASEALYFGLLERGAKIKVSVLCPGLVSTGITDSGRNRPPELQNSDRPRIPQELALEEGWAKGVQAGKPPQETAEIVFQGMREEKFYIFGADPRMKASIDRRMEDILAERNPGSASQ